MGKSIISSIALAALIACGPYARPNNPDCRSACGAYLTGVNTCERWNEHEAETIAAYVEFAGAKAKDVCEALDGWWFKIKDTDGRGWWEDEYGRSITGVTHFYGEIVELGSPCWGKNAYTHEVGHIYDEFIGLYGKEDDHWQWEERGYYRVIQETRIEDTCKISTTGEP